MAVICLVQDQLDLILGGQGENEARIIRWVRELPAWRSEFGEGTVSLLHQRSGDAQPYPVAITVDGDSINWLVTAADTANPGSGRCELQYIVGGVVVKSRIWQTDVTASLAQPGPVPEPQQGWVDQVLQETASNAEAAATSASQAATSAAGAAESAKNADQSAQGAEQALEETNQSAREALENIQTAETGAVQAISTAKEAGVQAVEDAQGAGVQAVQQAQQEAEQAISDLVPDVYTKTESDARYAPIESSIKVSGNGTGFVSLSPTVAWGMQGLALYGRSTQDGIPSVESPVPIVSAGQSGTLPVQVTDGGSQSKQFPIPTPNGLPGIPVESGGNWVDENGQQWVSDVVDFGARTRTQYIARYSHSDFNFRRDFYTQGGIEIHRFSTSQIPDMKERVKALCNIFEWIFSNPGNEINFSTDEKKIRIFFDESIETVEQANQVLAEKNAEFLVQLEIPIVIPLTDEEMAAYADLQSYPGTTNILAQDCGIEAKAVGDSNQIVASLNERLAALESAQTGI